MPGRNDPCPCGSGKKYKKCCLDSAPPQGAAPPPGGLDELVALYHARRYEELERRARLLAEQFPTAGTVWKVLGAALQMQGKDALHAMQHAAQFLPADAEAHYNLGNVLYDFGRQEEAAVCYRRALVLKPEFARAHNNLGFVLHHMGQAENALASFRRALEIEPGFALAHNSAGIVLRDLGRLEDAVASYRHALASMPDYAEAHYNLGNVAQEQGRLADAAASYRQALRIKPDFAQAHGNLGNALRGLGQLDEALACYRRSLAIAPNFAETHCNLGIALFELRQFDEARASYRRALEIRPDYAEAYYNLGNVLQEMDSPEDAITAYLQALALKPDFAEAHYNLGNALQELRLLDDAVTSYRRALEIKPGRAAMHGTSRDAEEAMAHVALGNVLLDTGDSADAEQHFTIALSLDPEQAEAHQGLACLFQRNGDEARAAQHRDLGFGRQPLSALAHRGAGQPVQLLVLGTALVGNMPWRFLVDRQVFQTTLMSVEYFDEQVPLPAHHLILNAIGDADICQSGLEMAARLLEKTRAPVINHPRAVQPTGRLANSRRLGSIAGVVTPRMAQISKEDFCSGRALETLEREGISFPLLLRPPGFHGGNYFVRADNRSALDAAIKELPGANLLAIAYLDSRSEDNLIRKYRIMSINGTLYPIHMAIAPQWKVHYFSSDMDRNEAHRREEAAFLNDFPSFLGSGAVVALEEINRALALDYCGIDFGTDRNGNILLYEANATMRINPLNNDRLWDYRRHAIGAALAATKNMFVERALPTAS
jgi:tetratricopeptide (TPR) repeat protein